MAKPRESLFIKCGENSGALVFEARWSRLPCVSVKYLLDIEPFDCMFFCARPGLTDCYSSNYGQRQITWFSLSQITN